MEIFPCLRYIGCGNITKRQSEENARGNRISMSWIFSSLVFQTFLPHCRCQCNGHADTCNEHDGTGCPCQNNTETSSCLSSPQSDRKDCYRQQVCTFRIEKQVCDWFYSLLGFAQIAFVVLSCLVCQVQRFLQWHTGEWASVLPSVQRGHRVLL